MKGNIFGPQGPNLGAVDPVTLAREMQQARVDARDLVRNYTGLSPMQLEGLGMSGSRCLCGKCMGPKISFASFHFDPNGGIIRIPANADPDETKP